MALSPTLHPVRSEGDALALFGLIWLWHQRWVLSWVVSNSWNQPCDSAYEERFVILLVTLGVLSLFLGRRAML